jgi:hypothetical protein
LNGGIAWAKSLVTFRGSMHVSMTRHVGVVCSQVHKANLRPRVR